MKKVFKKRKWLESVGECYRQDFLFRERYLNDFGYLIWQQQCEGKTEEEMHEMGYLTDESWMEEVE